MSRIVVVHCDGTPADRPGMALDRCRAFVPLPVADPAELAARARAVGYRVAGARDLCPSCVRTPHPAITPDRSSST